MTLVRTLAAAALLLSASVLPSLADPALDRIKSTGKVTVATEAAFEPFEFVRDGKIVGFGSDLLAEIVKDLGVEVEQLDLPFQGILAGLEAGQYDFIATTVSINPERAKRYGFTRPIGAIETVVVTLADNTDINEPKDIAGKLVGSQLGSAPETTAREFEETLKADGGGYGDLRLYQTFPDTMFALASGQVDAVVVGSTTAGVFMKTQPDTFRIVGEIGEPLYVAWVTRADDRDLRAAINATIGRLVDSGQMERMQLEWIGITMPTPAEGYLPEGAVE